ncbi:hypothetical protein QCA50_000703 [Cerrena zonata]|uniref:Transcription initiation factor TFIID subunit 4 n=1 Tax=Cerrena zonata TaxID=2478898 RepID=A0AAW0GV97_9APHY
MKAEDTPAQTPTGTTFSAAQWGNQAQIPIDPALQQQPPSHPATTYAHYQYQHYAQSGYQHYQYAPPQHQQHQQQPTQAQQYSVQPHAQPPSNTATMSVAPQPARPNTQPVQATTNANTNALDTTDVATLNDALGSAGVDLRAEEETLHRSFDNTYQSYRPYEDRSHKQPAKPNFDPRHVGSTMREIGNKHKVTKIPEDSVNYVALALRARLQDLITSMIAASKHRTDTQFDRAPSTYEDGTPMWGLVIRSDVAKQLAALEKVEREEEMKVRRERKEREDAAAAQAAALQAQQAAGSSVVPEGEDDGQPKKKKKKEGPGVTARNMSEDVRKKMSNAVASQAAGLGTGKYAWMNAASTTPAAKTKPAATTSTPGLSPATTTAPATNTTAGSSGWARPYVSAKTSTQSTPQTEDDSRQVVTLRDALFVIEQEKGHGGGRGSARGWT